MAFSLDQATRDGYASGLLRFTQYCDSIEIPEVSRMPASESLLAAFIAFHAGKVASSTIDNWLAGLHFWHTINGALYLPNGLSVLLSPSNISMRCATAWIFPTHLTRQYGLLHASPSGLAVGLGSSLSRARIHLTLSNTLLVRPR